MSEGEDELGDVAQQFLGGVQDRGVGSLGVTGTDTGFGLASAVGDGVGEAGADAVAEVIEQ